MDGKVVIVGGGRMGEALLAGLLDAGVCRGDQVTVLEVDAGRREALVATHGVAAAAPGPEGDRALGEGDVVLLAVKPQVLPRVLEASGGRIGDDALVVSIAAGVGTARIDELLPGSPAIVRVMPNTPALVRRGACAVAAGPRATADHLALVEDLLAPLGMVRTLPESSIDAVTALSGSGPAYVFLLAEALAEAGVLNGLGREDAVALANQTVAGAGELLVAGHGTATELREAVTSPGGTTAAALQVLEQAGVRAAVLDAVTAAAERARELG